MGIVAADITQQNTLSIKSKLAAFLELTKPRIAIMLVLTSAAGFYLGSKTPLDLSLFAIAMASITLLAFGVATLNQWLERDIDPLMKRTQSRPLPTGRITPNQALIFGIAQCVIAEAILYFYVNPLTAILGISVIVGYVFLYTPLKTRTSASTAIGAFPGAMPPLMGWTAAADEITLGAWALFVILFLWQFPHFLAIAWLYKEEYAKAGIKMLPVVEPDGKLTARQIVMFAIMLLPASLAPSFFGVTGIIYLIGAFILGVWFLYESVMAARAKTIPRSRRLLLVSVIYLPLLFGLMVIGSWER